MEENLAREMARMKMDKEKQSRQIEKICAESPELRELQNKIKSAYLNKERASQVTETQYRKQVEVVSFSKNYNAFALYNLLLKFILWCHSNGYDRKLTLKWRKRCSRRRSWKT